MKGGKGAAANGPVERRLRALAREKPGLAEAARIYGAILPLLRDAEPPGAPFPLTRGEARARMAKGLPLLPGLDLELDTRAAGGLLLGLARALELSRPVGRRRTGAWPADGLEARASAIRLALEEGSLAAGALLPLVAAGEEEAAAAEARRKCLDPGLLWTLAENALKPALRGWHRQVAPMVEGIQWRRGVCFACGAVAILGELQTNALVKHLRCGRCGADWPFPRLRCLYCGSEDHASQIMIHEEGRHRTRRVEACDACRGYLKVIAAFDPTPPEMLAVEDLATLHLDGIAREHGYARVAVR